MRNQLKRTCLKINMELNIDLLEKREKSVLLIILGLLLLCFPIFILIWRHLLPYAHDVRLLDNISYSLLFFSGVGLIIVGLGGSPLKIFGKAFIMIDSEKISVKNKPYVKVQSVLWSDIKAIRYDSCKYHIIINNNNKQIIDLSSVDYSLMNDVKKTVSNIALKKGLVIDEI